MFGMWEIPDDSEWLADEDVWLRRRYSAHVRNLNLLKAEMAMDPRMTKITVHRTEDSTDEMRVTVTYTVDGVKYPMNAQAATLMECLARARNALDKRLDALHAKNLERERRRQRD